MELAIPYHEVELGHKNIAVKVVGIFGNDAMPNVEATVGKKGN